MSIEVRYVTFGSKHEREDPREWVRADGFVCFEAPNEEYVYKLIRMVLGDKYAFDYRERPDRGAPENWYPAGQTAHIIMHFSTFHPSGWGEERI